MVTSHSGPRMFVLFQRRSVGSKLARNPFVTQLRMCLMRPIPCRAANLVAARLPESNFRDNEKPQSCVKPGMPRHDRAIREGGRELWSEACLCAPQQRRWFKRLAQEATLGVKSGGLRAHSVLPNTGARARAPVFTQHSTYCSSLSDGTRPASLHLASHARRTWYCCVSWWLVGLFVRVRDPGRFALCSLVFRYLVAFRRQQVSNHFRA